MRFTILVLVVQSVTSISNQICFSKNENTFDQQKTKIQKILHDEIIRAGIHQRGCILSFVRRSMVNDIWLTSPDQSPVHQFLKETFNINIINQGKLICFQLPNYVSRGRRKIQSTQKIIHRLPNLFHSKRKEFYQSVVSFYDYIAKKNC